LLLLAGAFEHDQGYVVELFARAELLNLIHDRRQQLARRQCAVPPQGVDEPWLAKLFFS
jgi:hypothetical protein